MWGIIGFNDMEIEILSEEYNLFLLLRKTRRSFRIENCFVVSDNASESN